jgi:hypothetical protein
MLGPRHLGHIEKKGVWKRRQKRREKKNGGKRKIQVEFK